MSKSKSAGLVMVILGLGALVGGYMWAQSMTFPKIKTEADCTTAKACPAASPATAYGASNVGCCAIWDKKVCRKGKVDKDGQTCVAAGNIGPMILMIVGAALLAGSLFTFMGKKADSDLATPNL